MNIRLFLAALLPCIMASCSNENMIGVVSIQSKLYITDCVVSLGDSAEERLLAEEACMSISEKETVRLDFKLMDGYMVSFQTSEIKLQSSDTQILFIEDDVKMNVSLGQDKEESVYHISGLLKRNDAKYSGEVSIEGETLGQHHLIRIMEVSLDIDDFVPTIENSEDMHSRIQHQHIHNGSETDIKLFLATEFGIEEYVIGSGSELLLPCFEGTMRDCNGCVIHNQDIAVMEGNGSGRAFEDCFDIDSSWISHKDGLFRGAWHELRVMNTLFEYHF